MEVITITAINWFSTTFLDDKSGEVWGWSLDLAWPIAARKTPEPVETRLIAHFARTYEVDREHALSDRVDPSKPLVFVLLEGRETASPEVRALGLPEAILIDGVHRLYKAIHLGLPTLPAVFLEPEEEHRVRLPRETVRRLLAERDAFEVALRRAKGGRR